MLGLVYDFCKSDMGNWRASIFGFCLWICQKFQNLYVIRSHIADKGTIIPYTILTIMNGAHVEQQNFIFSEDFNYDKILLISLLWLQRGSNPQPFISKRTLNYLTSLTIWVNGWEIFYKLRGCEFELYCNHRNVRNRACFEQRIPWIRANAWCRCTLKW